MRTVTKEEFEQEKRAFMHDILDGTLFIHPTDTIYGIGCNALIDESVKNVRDIKAHTRPFSVIVPSKEWILENCEVNGDFKKWIDKLPGAFTLILKLKNDKCISNEINMDSGTLGVRMIDHWFQKVVTELNIPILTTSANKTGEDFMTSVDNLDKKIESKMSFMVYEGEKVGHASTIVNLSSDETEIRER